MAALPDETVIDGEVVALDESGRPSFNTLQNYGSAKAPVFYYVFDVLVLGGRSVMTKLHEPYEVEYWTKHFKCTAEQLKAAVKKVGVMVKDVEKELKSK